MDEGSVSLVEPGLAGQAGLLVLLQRVSSDLGFDGISDSRPHSIVCPNYRRWAKVGRMRGRTRISCRESFREQQLAEQLLR